MRKVATTQEMQDIDRITINKYGIEGIVLMERAGLAVVSRINELYPGNRAIVFCGRGNNGGDGFVIARLLHNQGREVAVVVTSNPGSLKGDARVNYGAARKFGVKVRSVNYFLSHASTLLTPDSVVIDALLGTGLRNEVRPPLLRVIERINKLSRPVISVDIPSGISSDTGQIMGSAVRAGHTVTFGLPKRGHILYPGAEYTGELTIADIGFPRGLLESDKVKAHLVEAGDALSMMPRRPRDSHKGTFGHVLFIAGSRGKTGAALMAARACLKTGAGLVTIGIPDSLVSAFQSRVTEEMILPLPDRGDGTLTSSAADPILTFIRRSGRVLAVGPGLSVTEDIRKLAARIVRESDAPVVLDADGLNALAGRTGLLRKSKAPIILTPHPGEMGRLLQGAMGQDPMQVAVSFARHTGAVLVLKGAPAITAVPDGRAFMNPTGNPGMATAGTGDVLTGMIAALLAQKAAPRDAAVLGVYLHGLAGDMAARKEGERSLIASDLIRAIPPVIRSFEKR